MPELCHDFRLHAHTLRVLPTYVIMGPAYMHFELRIYGDRCDDGIIIAFATCPPRLSLLSTYSFQGCIHTYCHIYRGPRTTSRPSLLIMRGHDPMCSSLTLAVRHASHAI